MSKKAITDGCIQLQKTTFELKTYANALTTEITQEQKEELTYRMMKNLLSVKTQEFNIITQIKILEPESPIESAWTIAIQGQVNRLKDTIAKFELERERERG